MVMSKKAPNKGVNMKQFVKKILVVTSIALIMSSGATAALADDASTTSTTVPATLGTKTVSAERAAYRLALQTYNKSKVAIEKTFAEAMRTANATRRTAREAATTNAAKKTAREAFSAAISAAHSARTSALAALGNPPVKPVKAGETNN